MLRNIAVPLGLVRAHELRRRNGDPSDLFVQEVDVVSGREPLTWATALMRETGMQ